MLSYSPAVLESPSAAAVDHSTLDVEASDFILQTRPDTQSSDSQMDDGASDRAEIAVEQMDVGKVVPMEAEGVSCTTNVFSCLSVYIEDMLYADAHAYRAGHEGARFAYFKARDRSR